jgi:hypothetical protein
LVFFVKLLLMTRIWIVAWQSTALMSEMSMSFSSAYFFSVSLLLGFMIIFYLVELHTDGLYLMTETCHLTFPSAIEDVPAFLTNASKLKNVVYTFESRCTPAKDPAKILSSSKRKRATAPTSSMDMILEKSSSRKRRNVVSHFPN